MCHSRLSARKDSSSMCKIDSSPYICARIDSSTMCKKVVCAIGRAKWLNFLFLVPFPLQESTDQSSIQSQVLCARLKYFVQEYTQVLCARIYSSTLCKNRLKYYMQEE